ncbi:concanavalin A-like lectin/glucanase domain-containing protein [Leucosporidium creatinivorum]|uniref:Concanavalin A-like lectin/glucanase domain-containing protein n=1 Tax=Leucosporidium creatinivorum TaxID=106004 RepID=A0A1Y2G0R9_9BASI|nr:concanavalin A-like lectin/glucanase domain-containing protein [Leucosporidium creatinivorum]
MLASSFVSSVAALLLANGALGYISPHQLRWIERTSTDRTSSLPLSNLVKTTTASNSIPSGATALEINFSDYTSGNISSWLEDRGLKIYTQLIGGSPLTHTFTPSNVAIADGTLQLTVSAGATEDVKSAQVGTVDENLLYLKITTRAKAGKSEGVCSGLFTYHNDTQEADIEILTSYINTPSANGDVGAGLEFTNQKTGSEGLASNYHVAYPDWDPRDDFHDYTLEWTASATRFYVDGELWKEITTNVPSVPSSFIWNNWSSGNVGWTAGPPTEDNVLEIENITGWYTTA